MHLMLESVGLVLGTVGVIATFKFHKKTHTPDLMTLHSWFGMITICSFALLVHASSPSQLSCSFLPQTLSTNTRSKRLIAYDLLFLLFQQWLVSILVFAFPKASAPFRRKVAPIHATAGLAVFVVSIGSAAIGLAEKEGQPGRETNIINFTGLSVVFFAIAVAASTILPRVLAL